MGSMLNVDLIAILVGIAVFLIIAVIGVLIVGSQKSSLRKETGNKQQDLFEEYIGGDIEKTLKKLGADPTEYLNYCKIANMEPDYYTFVITRIIGYIVLFVGLLVGVCISNLIVSVVAMIIGLLIVQLPKKKVQKIATQRKDAFNSEIPRFLDMLHSALVAELPVQSAIEYTVKYLDGVLAEEMRLALAETEMGAKNWNEALFDVANKYENHNFSDFALDISTAYSKGVSVLDSVERKSQQIKESNVLMAKEKATQVSNQVLIPTVFFKMLPLILAMMLPILVTVEDIF